MDTRRARVYWTCQLAGWFVYDGLWLLPRFYAGDSTISAPRLILGSAIQSFQHETMF